ncbi:hypothetical protein Tsubulata_016569 [Turnera subulata]|uniref:CCHC-type domain-containing protein n=1 Tax=Turnera subulata TaxID=218843 RepID=A0A9Q0J5I9_9ROSI|nr:hypothetical protein Tsubulata_016569 [Turnera subulata]
MATRSDVDGDDDFSELYKEYTGPLGNKVNSAQEVVKENKRPLLEAEEEEEAPDPNAVPTDFTSREAKVWEAKSKATERNWKKRKEEEMICKICGESGHFTQGCPSTLGAKRKSQDFIERVAARENHVRAQFTEKVIQRIEKDIGCKIKMDEKFIIVSGKDRLILAKGVDAVHKVIKGEGDQKGSSGSHRSRSRSPQRSPVGSRFRRTESQRSYPSHPRDTQQYQQRFGRQDRMLEDRVHENMQKFSRNSPQGRDSIGYVYGILGKMHEVSSYLRALCVRSEVTLVGLTSMLASRIKWLTYSSFGEAYGNDGGRSRSSHSKSPARPPYAGNSYGTYVSRNSMVAYRTDGWDSDRRGSDLQSGHHFEYPAFPHTYEDLELEFKRDTTELGRDRDKEEDEENYKHRETLKEIRETYSKKLDILRGVHRRQWEEFLQIDAQRRQQQQAHQEMSSSGFSGYKQHAYPDYDGSSANPHHTGSNIPMDSRARYSNHVENFSSRPHDSYGEFQRQRREDFGKYTRY